MRSYRHPPPPPPAHESVGIQHFVPLPRSDYDVGVPVTPLAQPMRPGVAEERRRFDYDVEVPVRSRRCQGQGRGFLRVRKRKLGCFENDKFGGSQDVQTLWTSSQAAVSTHEIRGRAVPPSDRSDVKRRKVVCSTRNAVRPE